LIKESEKAAFEAGIKLGALYHQFIGMPINLEMIRDVEVLIEKSISNQPYVENVYIKLDREKVLKGLNKYGYTTLKSEMIYVEVVVKYGGVKARARLRYDEEMKYPLMELIDITESNE